MIRRQPLFTSPRAAALALGCLLGACTGDLGRAERNVWTETVAPSLGFWSATLRGEAASHFRMTDDEEQLRDRAWRLVLPAHERSVFARYVSDFAHARILPVGAQSDDQSAYFRALTGGSFVSQSSRYNRLAEDAGADRLLLAPFRRNALAVVAADRARLRTLEAAPQVPVASRDPAHARVVENEGLILWVCERVRFRVAGYRYALANLVVEMPSREAVSAERAIMALEAEVGPLCSMPLIGVFGGDDGSAQPARRPVVTYKG